MDAVQKRDAGQRYQEEGPVSRIRVALGDVQSAILRDILAQITDLEPDMELVPQVGGPDPRDASARQRPDVLICDVRPNELPEVCRQMFAELDPPVVVGLSREGREAAICIANAGPAQLMSVIRSAILGASGRKVIELVRPSDAERVGMDAEPYSSNGECLRDQLDGLDLALLSGIEALESTIWDDSVQRLQGLAISPGEVRALLQKPGPAAAPQRHSGELRRRRQRLADSTERRIAASLGKPDAPPFVRLIERFGLGPFEQFCIAAALALEIDRNKYGKAYALLQDDVTRKQPSLELLLRLYERPGQIEPWDAARVFETSRPLRRWNLLRLSPRDPGEPITSFGRRIEIDDRISRFLLGLEDLGSPLEEVAVTGQWEPETLRVPPQPGSEGRLAHLVDEVRRGSPGVPSRLVIHLHGRQGTGRRSLIAAVCQRQGLRLLRVDAGRLATLPVAAFEDCLLLLARESMLQPTALCLENVDRLLAHDAPSPQGLGAIAQALRTVAPVMFMVGQRPWLPEDLFQDGVFQSVAIELPTAAESRRIWAEQLAAQELDPAAGGVEHVAAELAGRFSLSPGQIREAAAAVRTRALWQRAEGKPVTLRDLYGACREQCSHRLETLARHVTTALGWDDLILPSAHRLQLRELEAAIRNASGVLEDWNFASRLPYGRGITALFSGPSGTGKTMAAGILARELGLDLYKIDLSRVVSKYIGETEKNLDRIFQQAEDANAMLFFDEADALFGKRSAIKDAHDRYANIEIAYLLQKMEERLGVTILATNLRTNMDDAFVRRIRFGIEFPMPEYVQRLQIWQGSLPREIRLADDVDLEILAKRLRMSGGSIMNVCVGAASLAYEPGGMIRMRHFLHAAKRELQKLGQQFNESDFVPPPVGSATVGRPGDGE
jgi:ATPase family associated with various cellular activities (AAA)